MKVQCLFRYALTILVVIWATTVLVVPIHAQNEGQGKYVTEAAGRLANLIGQANTQGYKLHDDVFSIGGGWLRQGGNNWVPLYTISLNAGDSYRFIASGDGDATDVDIEVQDPNGQVVASDTAVAADAVVNFTPQVGGRYLVRVRLYGSRNNLPCVCLAIALKR